jgi:3-deoxy-manno-octulosonate cytidylyltransferase (CMP-KDO synthetase)
VLTSKKCKTGTDRLNEVSKKIKSKIYINVQGDEPILNPSDLKKIINASLKNETYPIIGYTNLIDKKQFYSPNIPKIVFDKNNFLMYISRSPIPLGKIKKNIEFYKQICIYSFPKNVLHYYGPNKKKSNLENIEDIEIIRLIENSIPVKVLKLSNLSMAVDTKSDLRKVIKLLSNN